MALRVRASHVEYFGAFILSLVAVRRAIAKVYKAACGNGNAGDLDIRSRHPEQSLDGGLVTQNFFCEIVAFARFFGEEFDQFGLVGRSEEHTSELQSLMRISYAVFCLKKKKKKI